MGPGNDVFRGFGDDQIIAGGEGRDTLRLPAGTYTFAPSDVPLEGASQVSAVGATLIVHGFERVGLLGATRSLAFPAHGTTLTLA